MNMAVPTHTHHVRWKLQPHRILKYHLFQAYPSNNFRNILLSEADHSASFSNWRETIYFLNFVYTVLIVFETRPFSYHTLYILSDDVLNLGITLRFFTGELSSNFSRISCNHNIGWYIFRNDGSSTNY